MAQRSVYEFIKLGMNLQALRSIASVSIIPATSLVAFPNLEENQPALRCSVKKTVDLLKIVRVQLTEMGFRAALDAMAPLAPMQAEMEVALAQAPQGQDLILNDHFADKLITHVKNLAVLLKEEGSAIVVEA